jgi:D-psicose/D-tagatose/L-ribulose 3-epimerase
VVLAARVNLARDLASAEPAAHEAGIAYLESCVATAAALGATIVGGPLYGAPLVFAGRAPQPVTEDERRRRIDRVVSGLKRAGVRAEESGIRLAVEPLNRFETDIANTTRHALDLVEQAGSPAVGIMLDTFHMNMEEADLPGAIRRAGSRLFHFQANENHRGFVGSGHIDWPGIARALADAGYRGPITLEPFRRDDERPGIPLAQWRAPARDEDRELAASIAYLRGALSFARRAA